MPRKQSLSKKLTFQHFIGECKPRETEVRGKEEQGRECARQVSKYEVVHPLPTWPQLSNELPEVAQSHWTSSERTCKLLHVRIDF